jgi:superfamily II DNA helicase RecQ
MLKVLEAIARTHGRLGKNLLAQYLQGSQNAKVQRLRLERLAGFGMLQVLSQAQAVQVLDALLQVGILAQQEVTAHRPTVSMTPVGEAIVKGKDPWPELTMSKVLRGKLEALQPSPVAKAAPSPAVNSAAVNSAAVNTAKSSAVVPTAPEVRLAENVSKPDWYWTWRLLSDGYSWEHCLLIRQMDEAKALGDLRSSKGAGRPLPKALPQDVQAKLGG